MNAYFLIKTSNTFKCKFLSPFFTAIIQIEQSQPRDTQINVRNSSFKTTSQRIGDGSKCVNPSV